MAYFGKQLKTSLNTKKKVFSDKTMDSRQLLIKIKLTLLLHNKSETFQLHSKYPSRERRL